MHQVSIAISNWIRAPKTLEVLGLAAPTPTGFRFLESNHKDSKSGRGKQEKADSSLRLESGENTPPPNRVPRSDVFRYEGKKPPRSIN
jgi:hypothetical protein